MALMLAFPFFLTGASAPNLPTEKRPGSVGVGAQIKKRRK